MTGGWRGRERFNFSTSGTDTSAGCPVEQKRGTPLPPGVESLHTASPLHGDSDDLQHRGTTVSMATSSILASESASPSLCLRQRVRLRGRCHSPRMLSDTAVCPQAAQTSSAPQRRSLHGHMGHQVICCWVGR
ncbi:hypothetical protein AAFF_G00032220 [Aldrovandia affinis]|uniref:Uncharacterized protein n=1 Tax=Aldrovandia affinis TaxID=143900 RepID=A0AAD7WG26_9TELE|nr:hypothetical protein AAFF_G00032220 [Aldrovandia affinis]